VRDGFVLGLSGALEPVYCLIRPVVCMSGIILRSFATDRRFHKKGVTFPHDVTLALAGRETSATAAFAQRSQLDGPA
jgi:hypothetical protein